jgi:hypothetical protein
MIPYVRVADEVKRMTGEVKEMMGDPSPISENYTGCFFFCKQLQNIGSLAEAINGAASRLAHTTIPSKVLLRDAKACREPVSLESIAKINACFNTIGNTSREEAGRDLEIVTFIQHNFDLGGGKYGISSGSVVSSFESIDWSVIDGILEYLGVKIEVLSEAALGKAVIERHQRPERILGTIRAGERKKDSKITSTLCVTQKFIDTLYEEIAVRYRRDKNEEPPKARLLKEVRTGGHYARALSVWGGNII